MRSLPRCLAILGLLLLLSACAEPSIPYDRGGTPPVKTIGVIAPKFPDNPRVVLATNVGQQFGLVGALAEMAMESARVTKLNGILSANRLVVSDRFNDYLRQAVAEQGYGVIPVARPGGASGFLPDYGLVGNADAWLDCVVGGWGYLATGIGSSTPYRPVVVASCRLVDAGTHAILMRDQIIYNPIGSGGKGVSLAPDPAFVFVTFDQLTADPVRATAGVDAALQTTARAVGTLLK